MPGCSLRDTALSRCYLFTCWNPWRSETLGEFRYW